MCGPLCCYNFQAKYPVHVILKVTVSSIVKKASFLKDITPDFRILNIQPVKSSWVKGAICQNESVLYPSECRKEKS